MLSANDSLIHVSNLPENATEEFLRSFFSDCGQVLNVSTRQKPGNCFAFIQFDNKEAALRAVNNYNYTKLNGDPIIITLASAENMRVIRSGVGNIFIRGLDESIEASQLHELFSNFGDVISCRVPMQNGKNRGYAYVQFKDPIDAERATRELADATINGKAIQIEPFVKKVPKNKVNTSNEINDSFTNLCITGLPKTVRNLTELVVKFSNYGPVVSARINKERMLGFCNMGDHESAVRAMNGLNGSEGMRICRALTREERESFKALQRARNV